MIGFSNKKSQLLFLIVFFGCNCARSGFTPQEDTSTPPVFDGLEFAVGTGPDSAYLRWSPAGDGIQTIIYEIYASQRSGFHDFENPILELTETRKNITSLEEEKTYYFVVRAAVLGGDQDRNTVEKSVTTGASSEMVYIEGPGPDEYFLIDRYEASIDLGEPFGEIGSEDQDQDDDGKVADKRMALAHGLPWDDDGGEENTVLTTIKVRSLHGEIPSSLSWYQAAAACTNSGKRLCIDYWWVFACRGPDWLLYPYGNTYDGGDDLGVDCLTNCPSSHPATAAGTNTGCASHFGVYDLSGNLHDWTDIITPSVAHRRGGCRHLGEESTKCTSVDFDSPVHRCAGTGFRCCTR